MTSRRSWSARSGILLIAIGMLAAITLLVASWSSPVSAQATGSVELVAQSAWVDPGGIYDIQVRVAGADPQSSVVLRAYEPWPDRSSFLRLDLGEQQPVLELEPITLGDVQGASNEVLALQLAIAGPNTLVEEPLEDDAPISVLVSDGTPGVRPIEILLLDPDGNVADSIITSMIELPRSQTSAPLGTAIILTSNLPSGTTPGGFVEPDDDIVEDLATIVDAAATHPNAGVALSISPEALVTLQHSDNDAHAALLEDIRTSVVGEQLLPNPYVEIEEQAWVDMEMTEALEELYVTGAEATVRILGKSPDPSVALLDRTMTSSGLDSLLGLGVQGVIVRAAQIEPLDRVVFPDALTTRFLVPTATGQVVPALVADGELSNHFITDGEAVYHANRLLADLTILSLQNPDVRQAAVVLPPDGWTPDGQFLNVFLSGIERIPTIRAATPITALGTTAFTPESGLGTLGPPLRLELRPRQSPSELGSYRTEFNQARSAITSWSSVIEGDRESTSRLQELLRVSADSRHTPEQRTSYIDSIYSLIDSQKSDSITTPANETITLTGRLSDIPIVVENNLSVDASVLLLLDSEKLAFPDGREVPVVLSPGSNRIELPIEARASGDSPIRIQVLSPDRSILLGSSEVLVRTFAFSGVGIVIGIAAIGVLLIWWLRHRRIARDTVETLPGDPQPEPLNESLGV